MTFSKYASLGERLSDIGMSLYEMNEAIKKRESYAIKYRRDTKFPKSIELFQPDLDNFIGEVEESLRYADEGFITGKPLSYLLKLHKGLKQLDFSDRRKKFTVPADITDITVKEALEEAVEDYQNDCFDSTMAMCRKAYHLILHNLYTNREKKRPVIIGKNNEKLEMPLNELFKWFEKTFGENETVKKVGIIIKQLGDEAVHIPKPEPSRSTKGEQAATALSGAILLAKSMFLEFTELKNISSRNEGV